MHFHKSIIALLLLQLLSFKDSAIGQVFEEHLLNTQTQLPVSAIHSAYRDKEGYLWYGTVNGLCRDDGYNLRVFRPDFLQAQDRVIGSMAEDDDMHLWLGADNGLFWIDKRDFSIKPIHPELWEEECIARIIPVSNNRFWLQCRSQVALVDSTGTPIKQFRRTNPKGKDIRVNSMAMYDGKIYASFSDKTFARIDETNDSWIKIKTPQPEAEISRICKDNVQNGLWALYCHGEICHIDIDGGSVSFEPYRCDEPAEFHSYDIKQSPTDSTIWVVNTYGLRGYRPEPDSHTLRMVYSSMAEKPQYHMFASVLCDSAFAFVSAFDRPSYMLRKRENGMSHSQFPLISDRVKFITAVMDMAEDTDGWLWIFQERTGLCLVNEKEQKVVLWSDCAATRKYGLDRGRIIANSAQGGVWINHDDRMEVYRVERKGASMQIVADIDLRPTSQAGEIVSVLYEDQESHLWIGTNLGLYICHAKTLEPIASYPDLGYVSDAKSDSNGKIWITTLEGKLIAFDQPSDPQTMIETEPLSALCFADDDVWLGTQAGHIIKYNARTREMEDRSEACGMNGDRVNQMVSDRFSHIWIETNQRIIEYNGKNYASHSYSTNDAFIPMGRFLPTAVMTDSEGRICFGGIPGIICFEPTNSLDKEADHAETFITDIQVMKKSRLFDNGRLQPCESIELESDDRDLEIFFSSLDHYNVRQVRYAYRMVGVDKDWKYTMGGENSAFYNQLDKGEYTFEVKATDGNGLWSNHVARLKVNRLPAFYETKLAYACYLLLFLSAIAMLIRWVQKRDSKENERMWSDSKEMLKMRNYLRDSAPSPNPDIDRLPEREYKQLDQAFVQKVESSIQANLDKADFGVEELAASVNVSKSTLSRKLKSITGLSPLDYIRQIKMRQACLWLQDKDRNITEIAIALGYSDRKYFTSCFKKEFGQAPTEYRKEKLGIKSDDEQ